MGGASESYNVTFDSRYDSTTNPGLTFTLLNGGNVAISNPVTVPAYGTVEIKVQVSLDAALLTRARDKTITTGTTGRERFSEGGGYVVMTSTGSSPMVRVPVHIAARPASNMGVAETSITLPAAEIGTLSLTPSGTPVDTVDDGSLVYISELMGESPNDTWSTFSNNAADLKYIGAISDYTTSVVGASAFFSIATYGDWDTPTASAVEFDIYIDIDEDGIDDYVLYNTNTGTSTSPTDTMVSVLCSLSTFSCSTADFINWWGGGVNTNLFNNNVMTMDVLLESFGLTNVNTDFDFYVVTFAREAAGAVDVSDMMHYDVAKQSFSATHPVYGLPAWDDNALYSPTLDISYNKTNIVVNQTKGLLLLHQHNAVNTAEVLRFITPTVIKDTVGVFRPGNGLLYLKNDNTPGFADVAINYGLAGDVPVAGDWDGNGTATIGVYRNGIYYLRNSNTVGFANLAFAFGLPGDLPVVGDWNNDGTDTIGVYRNGTFYLRNTNDAGPADISFSLGNPGDVPVAGDWNGDGIDTVGVFRPSNGAIFLRNTNTSGFADIAINYGLPGDQPIVGDWNNDGLDTIGIYRNGSFYLRNSNTLGFADVTFAFGLPGDVPIAGNWDGLPLP